METLPSCHRIPSSVVESLVWEVSGKAEAAFTAWRAGLSSSLALSTASPLSLRVYQ